MRKHNFYAGPSTLPVSVLEQLRDQMVDYRGIGMSMVETSHRSAEYDEVHMAALEGLREHLKVPEEYDVLLLGGGATLQFGMVPMNLIPDGGHCDIVVSGSWSKKALDDIRSVAEANILFDGRDSSYTTLPDPARVTPSSGSSYVYIASNETIGGVQWKAFPATGNAPLVADMSSDILSRQVDVGNFGLIFAGAQKNLGPAGVTVVIIRKDLVEDGREKLPAYLSYRTHAGTSSLYNTPPVISVWALSLVMQWIRDEGGLEKIEERNEAKAGLVYSVMEKNPDFFHCPVDPSCRSSMNIVFRLPDEDLEASFIKQATAAGMVGLKGHRSVGGIRISLYNALPMDSARTVAGFMESFAADHGA
jgi:phosphoserine aminotransferase